MKILADKGGELRLGGKRQEWAKQRLNNCHHKGMMEVRVANRMQQTKGVRDRRPAPATEKYPGK